MAKKIFILLGNPDTNSLSGGYASSYEKGARDAGHEVRRMNIGEMTFDPILHHGYKTIQELEPDLKTFQENIKWCDHFVVVYPNWWCTMPALLKGMFDRAWLPGFAFRFKPNNPISWEQKLKGKSARVVIFAAAYSWFIWAMFGEFTNEISRATLGFAGMHPVRVKVFSPAEKASASKRERWIKSGYDMGRRGA